jgi:hypothetical protein
MGTTFGAYESNDWPPTACSMSHDVTDAATEPQLHREFPTLRLSTAKDSQLEELYFSTRTWSLAFSPVLSRNHHHHHHHHHRLFSSALRLLPRPAHHQHHPTHPSRNYTPNNSIRCSPRSPPRHSTPTPSPDSTLARPRRPCPRSSARSARSTPI